MTGCFLKLHTPTRVCEIIIRNWSAGQLVTLKTFVYCAACYAAETSSIASGCYPDIRPLMGDRGGGYFVRCVGILSRHSPSP